MRRDRRAIFSKAGNAHTVANDWSNTRSTTPNLSQALMSDHYVTFAVSCPRCRTKTSQSVAARTRDGRISVGSSVTCASCGLATEYDAGELDDASRTAFYATEGKWSLYIDDWGTRKLEAVQLLEKLLTVSSRELLQLVQEKRPVTSRTMVELDLISEILEPLGVQFARLRTLTDSELQNGR